MATQRDIFAPAGPGYAALIRQRVERYGDRALGVDEVAAVLQLSPSKVRELIEEGRIAAAHLNEGMTVDVGAGSARPMRPLWRVTAEALLAFAHNVEGGC